ncbi:MAG: hypothetical protein ACRED9_02375 [Caulobacteraceae bacterium]
MRISKRSREVWLWPLAAWLYLACALIANAGYAHIPGAPAKGLVTLLIAASQGLVVAIFLMDLRRSRPLVRLTAAAAFLWLLFMFVLSFADYLTRPLEF